MNFGPKFRVKINISYLSKMKKTTAPFFSFFRLMWDGYEEVKGIPLPIYEDNRSGNRVRRTGDSPTKEDKIYADLRPKISGLK